MMNDHPDFLDDLAAGTDPTDPKLAAALQSWRAAVTDPPVTPDARLAERFSSEPDTPRPSRRPGWLRRPAVAFAAGFAAVLLLGAGALALVARDAAPPIEAATTSSLPALAAVEPTPGEITLPADMSEQRSYAGCVFGELSAWFAAGFAAEEAPRLRIDCGLPPIPDLGPEAEAFRADLQGWADCVVGELDAVLPELPKLFADEAAGIAELERMENQCGEPPDPGDYGLALPFADFDLDEFDLDELRRRLPAGLLPDDFDLEELLTELEELDLEGLREGLLPEDLDLEDLRSRFQDFGFEGFEFDFGECDPAAFDDLEAGGMENFDFKTWFEEFENGTVCGFAGFLNPDQLDLESLDLEQLLSDVELHIGELGIEGWDGLENLNLEELLDGLFGAGELDLDSLLEQVGADA